MEKETLHARGRRLARIIRERRTREGERDRQRKGKRDRSSGELAAARYTLAAAALHARVRGVKHGAKRGGDGGGEDSRRIPMAKWLSYLNGRAAASRQSATL